MNISFTLLDILLVVTGALAIVDALARLRARRGVGVLAVVELIAGVLLILSLFITLPHLLGKTVMEIVLEVVLVLLLFVRGSGRGTRSRSGIGITVVALILNTLLLLLTLGWISFPGLHLT
ncbi:MAG: hypothetical protein JWR36_1114 [Glaciihabitans sp.]|jgi:hypothetical protein|nr:hypothetical protein [Glaciihabitans sp.]MDQ1570461.1 hypothetical protein [Actinomycetota bacterium]